MRRSRFSISIKITLSISISFLLILVAISLLILHSINIFLNREVAKSLTLTRNVILENPGEFNSDFKENLEEIVTDPQQQITIFNENGEEVYTKNQLFQIPFSKDEGLVESQIEDQTDDDRGDNDSEKSVSRVMILRFRLPGGAKPYLMQIVQDMSPEDNFLRILCNLLIIADLIGMTVSFLFGIYMSRRILSPVDKLTKAARSISVHDLASRIPETGPDDELTRLAKAFNEMLGRLENSFIKQNRFVSDASHELRTPIAIINGYVSMLMRWAKSNPDILEESIDAIKSETARMGSLVERLLFLAKTDALTLKLEQEEIRLDRILHRAVEETRFLAPGRLITMDINEELTITGDPGMIKQSILNLVDNSLKYSRPEGRIMLSLKLVGHDAVISVADEGPAIDPDKLRVIFDRFYRIDDSRSLSSGGAGLGLSIAKEIIQLHHGRLEASSKPEEGSMFTIFLPLTKPSKV